MEDNQISMAIQVSRFLTGAYDTNDWDGQCAAGWYDWFCNNKALANKTKTLYKKVIAVMQANKNKKFDPEKCYVFFKNNCPGVGSLYDSFSICDIETGDVLFWITPKSGHMIDKGEAQVCGFTNKFEEPLAKGKWIDVINYFKS